MIDNFHALKSYYSQLKCKRPIMFVLLEPAATGCREQGWIQAMEVKTRESITLSNQGVI
jgi:hypothetical protein